MLPSGHWDGVGTPESGFRGSITPPTSPSVNASPASSRTPAHDSRSPWIATPSMQDVLMSPLQAGLSRRSPVGPPAAFPAHRHRVQRRPPRLVTIGIGVELRLHQPLQEHGHHRLGNSVSYGRYSENSDPSCCFRDFHGFYRRWEIRSGRHPVPQPVQVIAQILLELPDRLPVHSRRALIGLDPLIRLPDHLLRNLERFTLRP